MADNATISDTQHRNALLESIEKFGAENPPLDLTPLISALKDNSETEAQKAAEDIFSGSPTNTKRMLEIHQQVLQGLTRTSFVTSYNSLSLANKEKKETQRNADFAFLNMLSIQNDTFDTLNTMLKKIKAIHASTHEYVENITKTADDIEEKITETFTNDDDQIIVQDALAHLDQIRARATHAQQESARELEQYNQQLTSLKDLIRKLPRDAQELANKVIRNEENGLTADQASLTGQFSEQLKQSMLQELKMRCPDKDKADIAAKFETILEKMKESSDAIKHYNTVSKTLSQRLSALAANQSTLSPEQLRQQLKEISELEIEFENARKQKKEIVAQNDAYLEENEGLVQTIQSIQDKIEKTESAITQGLGKYESRHEQIKAVHKDGMLEWMQDFMGEEKDVEKFIDSLNPTIKWGLNIAGFDMSEYKTMEDLANAYIEYRPLLDKLQGESETIKAWTQSLKHEGEYVYRNNENGTLYTYNDETGTRTFITDPDTITSLYSQAYGEDVKLFRNETPFGHDPLNNFATTIDDINNLTTKSIQNKFKSNTEDTSTENEHKPSVTPALAPSIKGTFQTNAAKIEASEKELGQAFQTAKARTSPNILNIIDNAEYTAENNKEQNAPNPFDGQRTA